MRFLAARAITADGMGTFTKVCVYYLKCIFGTKAFAFASGWKTELLSYYVPKSYDISVSTYVMPFLCLQCFWNFQHNSLTLSLSLQFRESASLGDGFSFQSIVSRPHSAGSVQLKSADPFDKPYIRTGMISESMEHQHLVWIRVASNIFAATLHVRFFDWHIPHYSLHSLL